jgi:hypothetical protein
VFHLLLEDFVMKRYIVCGGRDFAHRDALFHALDRLRAKHGDFVVVSGGARGADRIGEAWATARGLHYVVIPALWDHFGKSAGPKRNQAMLDIMEPDGVVAFPGVRADGSPSRGTACMVRFARKAGVRVWEPLGPIISE